MGLLQNGFRDKIGVFRIYGAGVSNGAYPYTLPANFHLTGMQRNLAAGEGIPRPIAGIPMGHLAPSSWSLPQKAGGMSAFTSCRGVGAASATGAEGRGLTGQSEGLSTADAQGTALSWGTGTADGSSTVSCSIVGLAFIAGTVDGLSEAIGLLFASVNISGEAAGTSEATVSGSLAASMIGLSEGSCEVTGSMSALLNMNGEANGVGGAEAIIIGAYYINGEAAGTSEAMATNLEAYGWLTGQAEGGCSISVIPYADGFMSGTTIQEQDGIDFNALADAVVSALNSTTIPVDTKKINGTTLSGNGTAANPWGPV